MLCCRVTGFMMRYMSHETLKNAMMTITNRIQGNAMAALRERVLLSCALCIWSNQTRAGGHRTTTVQSGLITLQVVSHSWSTVSSQQSAVPSQQSAERMKTLQCRAEACARQSGRCCELVLRRVHQSIPLLMIPTQRGLELVHPLGHLCTRRVQVGNVLRTVRHRHRHCHRHNCRC